MFTWEHSLSVEGYLSLEARQGGEHGVELDDVQTPRIQGLQDGVNGRHCHQPPVSHASPLRAEKPKKFFVKNL